MSQDCEKEMDDDAESIITNQRYAYISQVVDKAVKKKAAPSTACPPPTRSTSIVTNRILALPIFARGDVRSCTAVAMGAIYRHLR